MKANEGDEVLFTDEIRGVLSGPTVLEIDDLSSDNFGLSVGVIPGGSRVIIRVDKSLPSFTNEEDELAAEEVADEIAEEAIGNDEDDYIDD